MYVCIYLYLSIILPVCLSVCLSVCVGRQVYIYTHKHSHKYMCVCVCVCVCVCAGVVLILSQALSSVFSLICTEHKLFFSVLFCTSIIYKYYFFTPKKKKEKRVCSFGDVCWVGFLVFFMGVGDLFLITIIYLFFIL